MEGVDVSKYWMLCICGIIALYIIAYFVLSALGKKRRQEYEQELTRKGKPEPQVGDY
ncbi:MAG: hypothetical protein ACOX7U_07495 [Desulfitobacteriia bacterium]|jgi:hypothetical protein